MLLARRFERSRTVPGTGLAHPSTCCRPKERIGCDDATESQYCASIEDSTQVAGAMPVGDCIYRFRCVRLWMRMISCFPRLHGIHLFSRRKCADTRSKRKSRRAFRHKCWTRPKTASTRSVVLCILPIVCSSIQRFPARATNMNNQNLYHRNRWRFALQRSSSPHRKWRKRRMPAPRCVAITVHDL